MAIRKFYTWLRGTQEYPPEVAWLRVHTKVRNARTAENMLTEEEVKRLIEHARTVQERAIISSLPEGKSGEIRQLRSPAVC